jgi:hypothetical protein
MDMHVAAPTAAEAHRAAVARHAEAVEEAAVARGEVERQIAARQHLLGRQGATHAELKKADTTIADASRRAELAEAQAGAACRAAERAEIEALREQAADFERRLSAGSHQVARAGDTFRLAMEAARAALADVCNAGFDLSVIGNGAALFGEDLRAAATSNTTLAALEPSQWPRVRSGARLDPIWHSLRVELLERGGEDPVDLHKLLAGLPRLTEPAK